VEYPEVKIGETEVFFGLCKTFTQVRKEVKVRNEQGCGVSFRVRNPLEFYELEFYDFYEFDEEEANQYKRKRLTIVNQQTGQPINQHTEYTIEAGT